ncbi:SOS response-associated peptidase [Winogradskyella endarachnes]|uniref:Abasic site processing protein n=1 Tax=Winogradskyella endarachnes TaxID=2681965 RepID=A0A6L6UBQ6_9FLAO|nr:SOS response-associated peptidase [Winogradskyella endarachnes]MUU79781.1 SOS response-associated peptidase [Winogradskyella endarachnes]
MCYDIKASTETQLKRAERKGDLAAVSEILERLIPLTDLPLFHVSGFTHPELLIYTNDSPYFPVVATWGLVPQWIKDNAHKQKIWNSTLNARGETIFEKPSFKQSANHKRCIIYVDGFYEYHHFNNKTYPFYIQRKDEQPMALAGLWNEWINPEHGGKMNTFSIVTTVGNTLMTKIHNNPKLKGPRMPLILKDELEEQWLQPIAKKTNQKALENLIKSYPDNQLKAHTVSKLRGKSYIGNVEEISEEVYYKELVF